MKHAAIPTHYNGIRFRSRLEARWAAFFDIVGWQWEYEPIDLDGWIPDFVLTAKNGGHLTLVEVKPVHWSGRHVDLGFGREAINSSDLKKVQPYLPRFWNGDTDVLILGAHIYDDRGEPVLGALPYRAFDEDPEVLCDVALACVDFKSNLGFYPLAGEWTNRISGTRETDSVGTSLIEPLWREAGNLTQWRGRN